MDTTPSRRGRPPRLTREAIVAAALDLLDEQGLEALSMRALAGRLGVDPMAIYRHVPDKDGLLTAVCDSALHELTAPVLERADEALHWRPVLEEFGLELRATMQRHPGLVPVMVHAPLTVLAVELTRGLLGRFESAGLPLDLGRDALTTVFAYVIGASVLEQSAGVQTAEVAALREEAPDDVALTMWDSQEIDVAAGLATVLDGIEARASMRSAPDHEGSKDAVSAPSGRGRGRRSRGG